MSVWSVKSLDFNSDRINYKPAKFVGVVCTAYSLLIYVVKPYRCSDVTEKWSDFYSSIWCDLLFCCFFTYAPHILWRFFLRQTCYDLPSFLDNLKNNDNLSFVHSDFLVYSTFFKRLIARTKSQKFFKGKLISVGYATIKVLYFVAFVFAFIYIRRRTDMEEEVETVNAMEFQEVLDQLLPNPLFRQFIDRWVCSRNAEMVAASMIRLLWGFQILLIILNGLYVVDGILPLFNMKHRNWVIDDLLSHLRNKAVEQKTVEEFDNKAMYFKNTFFTDDGILLFQLAANNVSVFKARIICSTLFEHMRNDSL